MSSFVSLFDIRVVDGLILRFDVVVYLDSAFNELSRLSHLIVEHGDFLGERLVNSFKRMFFKQRDELQVNLYFLHEVNVLSDRSYKRMCEKLSLLEKEIG